MNQLSGKICAFFTLAISAASAYANAPAPYVWANAQVDGGGFVSGIITNPHFPVIYCRTDVGGAYRWNPRQNIWIPLDDWVDAEHWNYMGTESIATDPEDGKRVFIAAGMYTNTWAGNGAVLRSFDQGASWKIAPLPFKLGGNENGRNNGERLTVDPNDGNVLYLGSRHAGLWRSTDAAEHWQQVTSFPQVDDAEGQGIVYTMFDEASGKKGSPTPAIYVGVTAKANSIYCSLDGGRSWQTVPGAPSGFLPHKAAWDHQRCLYLTYGDAPGPNDVSNGAVWKLNAANGQWSEITPLRPSQDDKFGYQGVTIDQTNPRTIMVSTIDRYGAGDDIFRTTDGGQSWKPISPSSLRDFSAAPWMGFGKNPAPNLPIGHWIASVEIDPFDSNHALYCTGWGVWGTNNLTDVDRGGKIRWQVAAKGIEELVANKVISPSLGAPVLSVVWDVDGFRHEKLDQSPSHGMFFPEVGRNSGIDFAELKPTTMARVYGGQILGHDFGRLTGGATSEDDGVTWTAFATRPRDDIDGQIAVAADGSRFVWSPENGPVCFSTDMGKSWDTSSGIPAKIGVLSDRVSPMVFYGFDSSTGTLYSSANGARSFSAAARNLPKLSGDIHAVPDHAGELWLATGAGLFYSNDGGATFQKDPAVQLAYRVGYGKAAPGGNYPAIYITGRLQQGSAASGYGFFRSDDGGVTFVRINDDQHQFGLINSITGDPRIYGRLYLASDNRGIVYGQPAVGN